MKILLIVALLLIAGCEPNANASARRYHDCVAVWAQQSKKRPRTFDKAVHDACLLVAKGILSQKEH